MIFLIDVDIFHHDEVECKDVVVVDNYSGRLL